MECSTQVMLRIEEPDGWTLIAHRDHARLASEMAQRWGNRLFPKPEPFEHILVAVERHDDAWIPRDGHPHVTREGRPGAFSRELVGHYLAFEEMDLIEYLAVRGRATEEVASADPYAAIIVSMHTENLLTEQADLTRLTAVEREAHQRFVSGQRLRQQQLAAEAARAGCGARHLMAGTLRRAFEFLQACDSLSLLACVAFPTAAALRHSHRTRTGRLMKLSCEPLDTHTYRVSPYPFDHDELLFNVPTRRVVGRTFASEGELRIAYGAAQPSPLTVRVVR